MRCKPTSLFAPCVEARLADLRCYSVRLELRGLKTSSYAVIDFILSRDAVRAVDDQRSLRGIFGNPDADMFARYPTWWALSRKDDFESLYNYYLGRVEAWYQSKGGIITLKVVAFTPEDAKLLSDLLLIQSELLINRMNERSNADFISFAERQLTRAEAMLLDAQQKITDFRNKELILDPVADSGKALDLIGTLTAELADAQRQLKETSEGSPYSPMVQSLRSRISALDQQIATEKSKIVGNDKSLVNKIAMYERLVLDRGFADRNLTSTFDMLQLAQQNAWHQQLYIETIANSYLPDKSTEPRSARWVSAVFVISSVLCSLIWLVVAASKEHAS